MFVEANEMNVEAALGMVAKGVGALYTSEFAMAVGAKMAKWLAKGEAEKAGWKFAAEHVAMNAAGFLSWAMA